MFHFFCCGAVGDLSPLQAPLLNQWLWCGSHSWLFTLPPPPPPHARRCHQPFTPVPSRPWKRNCDTFSEWNRKAFVCVCVCVCVFRFVRERCMCVVRGKLNARAFTQRSAYMHRLAHSWEMAHTYSRRNTVRQIHARIRVRRVNYGVGGCVWTRRGGFHCCAEW